MRFSRIWPTFILLSMCLVLVACNDGLYSNPTSPPATTTEWRVMTADSAGGSFAFSDIGAYVSFPPGAIPAGEIHTFRVRLFPEGIPLLPSGPVLVRLGTFEFDGPEIEFDSPVEVKFRLAEQKSTGLGLHGYWLNAQRQWEFLQSAPVVNGDGSFSVMHIDKPGIYGAFQFVHLHVEATVSRQQGPIPLTVGFKAIIIGGHPPYQAIWHFGDNEDPEAGISVSHAYLDPGVYTAGVIVVDADENWVSDWLTLTAYYQAGPPTIP